MFRPRADNATCFVDLSSSMPLPRESAKRIEDFIRNLGPSALRKSAIISPGAFKRVQARHLVTADELFPVFESEEEALQWLGRTAER